MQEGISPFNQHTSVTSTYATMETIGLNRADLANKKGRLNEMTQTDWGPK